MVIELFLLGLFETARLKTPNNDLHLFKYWKTEYIIHREIYIEGYKRKKEQDVHIDA